MDDFTKRTIAVKPSEQDNLSEERKENLKAATKSEYLETEGIGCDKKLEPIPNFRKAPCEIIAAQGENNTQIVMGRDRPAGLLSGYGGRGDSHSGAIDIVVGRHSSNIREKDSNGDTIYIDNDFSRDAARIYISQRTDIDKNFGIAKGKAGNIVERSGIGIKADAVRIIGTEGIKLVTRVQKANSLNGSVSAIRGIDLIAGNLDKDMQPMVKGKNLTDFLEIVADDISRLAGLVNSLASKQCILNSALSAHTHPIVAAPVVTDPVTGLGVANGVTTPSIEAAVGCTVSSVGITATDIPSHVMSIINGTLSTRDYLKPFGAKYILSSYNHTN